MHYVTYCKSARGTLVGTENRELFCTATIAFDILGDARIYADALTASGYQFVIVTTESQDAGRLDCSKNKGE